MHPKCIRNLSEIYPKFNLLSLDLCHSNTIKIKTSIHISSYITYIYPKFIPNSTFSPYIWLTQLLQNLKYIPNASEMHQKSIRNLSQIQPSLPISHLLKYCKNPKCIPNLLADENGLKLDQIPPIPRYITNKINDYIPCVHFKVNRVGFWLICTHRWRVNLKKWQFLGFLADENGLKLDQIPPNT